MTAPTTPRRCDQCGRVGSRGFRSLPAEPIELNGMVVVEADQFTECAAKAACRKRWPKPAGDEG